MKISIWTTSLQADTLALAIAMDRDPEIDLLIIAASLAAYRDEPIAQALPLNCPIIDRQQQDCERIVKKFNADIVIADNHLPKFQVGRKLVFHWHGIPLKIRPPRDIRGFHRNSKRLVGSVKKSNPDFLAQCYGEMDYNHRLKHWGLHAQNCKIWGSAYSDLLLNPPYNRSQLTDYYSLDLTGRKNILLSLTWNFGNKAFGILGDDDEIFSDIMEVAHEHEANIIFSLHDSYRYPAEFKAKIEYYARQYPYTFLKYKDQHADNLADLITSDVMICNFSSFIVFHYFTNKPSLHIAPVDTKKRYINLPTLKKKQLTSVIRRNNHKLWIYPFSDCGGSLPENGKELVRDLRKALADPQYKSAEAKQFIEAKIHRPDGKTRTRIINDLKSWL